MGSRQCPKPAGWEQDCVTAVASWALCRIEVDWSSCDQVRSDDWGVRSMRIESGSSADRPLMSHGWTKQWQEECPQGTINATWLIDYLALKMASSFLPTNTHTTTAKSESIWPKSLLHTYTPINLQNHTNKRQNLATHTEKGPSYFHSMTYPQTCTSKLARKAHV